MFGYKKIFLYGCFLMLGASILLSLFAAYPLLLIGRLLMGIGGGMVVAVGPAIIGLSFTPQEKGKALGWQAVLTYTGQAFTPVFGGFIGERWGWQALFYLNIPIVLILLLGGYLLIPKQRKGVRVPFDMYGAIFFLVVISSFVLLLDGVEVQAMQMAALAVLFISSLGLFIWWEIRQDHPIINLKLLKIPSVSYGAIGVLSNYICFSIVLFLTPYYFTDIVKISPTLIGATTAILPVMLMIVSPLAGTLSDKIGAAVPMISGMSLIAVSLFMFSWLNPAIPFCFFALAMILFGLGMGLFISPNNAAILNGAPKEVQGVVSGIIATARYTGWILGVSLGGTLFSWLRGHGDYLTAFHTVMIVGIVVALLGMWASRKMTASKIVHVKSLSNDAK
jgi:MFS family permease